MLLHRLLEGDEEVAIPWEWWIGLVCEEFHCLPSAALLEMARMPVGTLERIVEYRAFASAKGTYDSADTAEAKKRIPRTPLFDLVKEVDFAVAEEDRQHNT